MLISVMKGKLESMKTICEKFVFVIEVLNTFYTYPLGSPYTAQHKLAIEQALVLPCGQRTCTGLLKVSMLKHGLIFSSPWLKGLGHEKIEGRYFSHSAFIMQDTNGKSID